MFDSPHLDRGTAQIRRYLKNIAMVDSLSIRIASVGYWSTRIKDAGIAIRHSQGYTFSILQGPKMDFREWTRCVDTQKTENHIKNTLFSYGKIY